MVTVEVVAVTMVVSVQVILNEKKDCLKCGSGGSAWWGCGVVHGGGV